MCRLFASISPKPQNARDLLVDSCFSILRQSNFNKNNLQKDGWGLAYFKGGEHPSIYKSPGPLYEESERFTRFASRTCSRVIIGHIRAASNPRGLPFKRLISMENTQPFTDGRWVFAHNGTLEIPLEVARRLGILRKKLKGFNDSEVYFWQFIKFQRAVKDVAEALKACVRENWEVWKSCRGRYPGKRAPYTSLNAVFTDGRRLYAFNHFLDHIAASKGRWEAADRALCAAGRPWSVMSFSRRKQRLVIASEDLDRGSWRRMRPPELICAEVRSGRLMVKRRSLEAR